ncbi:MAG: hypothetical protein GY696_14350 [Gammaproteobacteria bacterium]|nr:hypothetical protein [Gammaproteobacteria bacterium]
MENTACAAEHTPGEQPGEKTYAVLTKLAGLSCVMMKTEWRYQCEPSSQLRLATLPYIRMHVQLSVEECRNMTLHRTYRPPGQEKIIHLRMGKRSHLEVSQDGQLLEDQGQPAPPAHILMELQVKIQQEHLVANLGQVSSEDGRLWLPCLMRENGCQTLHKT